MAAPVSVSQRTVESVMNPTKKEQDVRHQMMGFCGAAALAQLADVNKAWRQAVGQYLETRGCWNVLGVLDLLPETLPTGMSRGQVMKHVYRSFGPHFYRRYFGGSVDAPPPISPAHIVGASRPGFRLVYHPRSIKISLENSSLILDGNGMFIEGPAVIEEKRTIEVPWNLRNEDVLIAQCLGLGSPSNFHPDSLPAVLEQHGATPVQPHWSCQKEKVIALERTFAQQQAVAAAKGLEVISLPDRVDFNLLTYVSSGRQIDDFHVARTSTPTLGNDNGSTRLSSTVHWLNFKYPISRLGFGLRDDVYSYCIGVAVGVPAGGPQAIGP